MFSSRCSFSIGPATLVGLVLVASTTLASPASARPAGALSSAADFAPAAGTLVGWWETLLTQALGLGIDEAAATADELQQKCGVEADPIGCPKNTPELRAPGLAPGRAEIVRN